MAAGVGVAAGVGAGVATAFGAVFFCFFCGCGVAVICGSAATESGSLPCSAAAVRRSTGSLPAADAALADDEGEEAKRAEQPSTGVV